MPPHPRYTTEPIIPHIFRLKPGQDLKLALIQECEDHGIEACCILTCVGSLIEAVLRFADANKGQRIAGPREITSLVGTLSRHGGHLHIALSDGQGAMCGGHVMEGCIIHTTAEIVLGILPGLQLTRAPDPETGYGELHIAPIAATNDNETQRDKE